MRRSLHDKLGSASRRHENGVCKSRLVQRIAVEGDQLKLLRLAVELHLQWHEILDRGIGHAPEFLSVRLHLNDWIREGGRRRDLVIDSQLVRSGNPRNQILLADNKHALWESRYLGPHFFHSLNNQRTGSAPIHLELGEPVHVGMVPIQSWRLVGWNLHVESKCRFARLKQSREHIVLMANGGNIQAVKVNVGRRQCRRSRVTANRQAGHIHCHGGRFIVALDAVFDVKNQAVALVEAQCRSLNYSFRGVIVEAIVIVPTGIDRVPHSEFGIENAVHTAQT